MSGLIPADIVESVRKATDIVQLIGEYVRLEKKGKNYVGSCPFHQERDPSFTVSPEKQIFYCFGCGAGGNVFRFLMLSENLSFPEAVHRLAARVGIAIPRTGGAAENSAARLQERAWEVNGLARDFYRQYLNRRPEAVHARSYLQKRGVSSQTAEIFQLGYAPPQWDALLHFLASRGCSSREAVSLGLLVAGERGKPYDRFRNRLIFPICDAQGRVAGFGGRVLDDGQPKYLNTPETVIFNKRHLLYGLHLARAAIRELGFAIIMEGYMDVVTAHQHGINNAVASMGTSLTPEQGKLLLRYTNQVVIAYDADAAGEAATGRGLDLLQELGFRIRVVNVPEGKDPDEFIRLHGREGWRELLARAESLLDYKLNRSFQEGGDSAAMLARVLPNLAAMPGELEREEGIRRVAARLSLSWEAVKDALKRYQSTGGKKWSNPDKNVKNKHNIIKSPDNARFKAEFILLQILLQQPHLLPDLQREVGPSFPKDAGLREIYQFLCRFGVKGDNPARWMDELTEQGQRMLSQLLLEKTPGSDPVKIMPALVKVIRNDDQQEQKTKLLHDLAEAERKGDKEQVALVLSQLQELVRFQNKGALKKGGMTN
ncbi:MAG: DNA primase [Thermoanaerobacteraceae bacterium]|nr:DNA primase [Thermoanaerobacteraceae bacterium]